MPNTPTIYFICPTNRSASGGVKQMYRQVQVLNEAGYHAIILHRKIGKVERWFHAKVPIKYNPWLFKRLKYDYRQKKITFTKKIFLKILRLISCHIEKDAILVFPEIYGPRIHKIMPLNKRVIFNQNCYYTFDHFGLDEDYKDTPYNSTDTLATIVASEDAKDYFNYAFPHIKTLKMNLGIDHNIFSLGTNKKKQICFMPRKLGGDVAQVINILRLTELPNDWSLISIDNKTESEVAAIMKESMIFLSFNFREGFGLPPVEAMACGCYIIGYIGQGGREYFNPSFTTAVNEGNIIDYVESVKKIIDKFNVNQDEMLEKGRLASKFVFAHYTIEKETEDTLNIWNEIMQSSKLLAR
ncbi:glycosyltransferase [Sphingobacterium siyangense]|uniref:glycosyltransferase n=2 Tax=Sphingobacteriaceae TaxID=84566 RepID=UPI00200CDCE4|nr:MULTISPECIES: glycosyltransferase [Sphingobacterium]UQA74861.1 glycosyltransferase [Sphingobacterium siyangense]